MKTQAIDSKGLFWGFVSYALWGFFPLYWKLLSGRSAPEILVHRMLWSFVFYLGLYFWLSRREFKNLFQQRRQDWLLSALSSILLTINWGVFIFAVISGHILEGSLAYFINPILNVIVGVLFFKESFPLILRISAGLTALGVLTKIADTQGASWIALTLAFTFCGYGITKKLSKIPPRTSSVLEGAVGFVPALMGIIYFRSQDAVSLSLSTWLLLIGGGVVTGLPLFLFSYAAQRIPYSLMGMLQFIAPTLQFLVGVVVYKEHFGKSDFLSFGLIWLGIAFYLSYQILVVGPKSKQSRRISA